MDLKQQKYIVEIYREKSIAGAAEKLFITQSALNQQLLKIEKDLGTPLFERHYREMIPTLAGKIYIETAERMIDMKQETYKIIRDISNGLVGEISIAYTPERGTRCFCHAYPIFHKEYPEFRFKTYEARVLRATELLLHHDTTFAQVTYSSAHPLPEEFAKTNVHKEYMILAIPDTHPLAHLAGKDSARKLPTIDLRLFKEDDFVLCSSETSLRALIDELFRRNDIKPKIQFESVSSITIQQMILQGLGIGFLPAYYADPSKPLVYFRPKPCPYWTACIAYLKGTYITKPEKRFLELMDETFLHEVR